MKNHPISKFLKHETSKEVGRNKKLTSDNLWVNHAYYHFYHHHINFNAINLL